MYREEYVPPTTYPYLDTLTVGPQAGHIMQAHQTAIERGDWNKEILRETLETNDPQLHYTMRYIAENFDMEDTEIESFCDGFVMAYTAIATQAELIGDPLPGLNEELGAGYAYDLEEVGDEYIDYINMMLAKMERNNPALIECLVGYFQEHQDLSVEEKNACRIGLVLAHDIIAQQVNANELVRSRSADVS